MVIIERLSILHVGTQSLMWAGQTDPTDNQKLSKFHSTVSLRDEKNRCVFKITCCLRTRFAKRLSNALSLGSWGLRGKPLHAS